jgi:hypothetical protein
VDKEDKERKNGPSSSNKDCHGSTGTDTAYCSRAVVCNMSIHSWVLGRSITPTIGFWEGASPRDFERSARQSCKKDIVPARRRWLRVKYHDQTGIKYHEGNDGCKRYRCCQVHTSTASASLHPTSIPFSLSSSPIRAFLQTASRIQPTRSSRRLGRRVQR